MNQPKQAPPPQQWHYTLTTNERQKFVNLLKHAISQMPNQQYDLTRIHQLAENFERYSFMHSKSKEQYGNSCKQKLLEIKQVIDGNNRRMNEQNNNGNNAGNNKNIAATNNVNAINYNGNNSFNNANLNSNNNNTNPTGMNANLNNLTQEQIQSFLARQAQARQQAALRQQQPQGQKQSQQPQFNMNQQQPQQASQPALTPQQQQQARLIADLKSQPIPQPLLAKIPGLPPGVNTWVQIMELAKQQAFTPQVMQQIKQVHNAHNQMLIARVREQTLAAANNTQQQQQQQQQQQPINPQHVLQRQQMINMKMNQLQQPQQIQPVPQQPQQQLQPQQQPQQQQQGMVLGQPRITPQHPQQPTNHMLQASSNAQYIKEATSQALQLFKKLQADGRIAHDIPDEQRQVFIKKFIMSQLELMKKKNAQGVPIVQPQQQQQAINNMQKNQARLGQGNANISPAQVMLQQQLQLQRQQSPQQQKNAAMGLNYSNPVQVSPQRQQQPLPTQGRWNTTPQMNQTNLAQFPPQQTQQQQHFDNQKLLNNPMMPAMTNTQLPTHQMQQRLRQQGLPTSGQPIGNNMLPQQQQKQQQQQYQQQPNFRTATTANASAQDKLELKALIDQSANFAVTLRNLTNEMGPNDKKYMNSQIKTLLQMLQITDNVIPSFFFISKNKDATRKLLSMRVMLKIIIEGLRKNEYYANQELYSKIQLQIQKYLTFIKDYNNNNAAVVNPNPQQQQQQTMQSIQNSQQQQNILSQVPLTNLQQQQLNSFSTDIGGLNASQMMMPNIQHNDLLSTQLQQQQQLYQMSPNMANVTPMMPHQQIGAPSVPSSASTTGKKLTPTRRKAKVTPKLTKAQQAAADAALVQQQQQLQQQQNLAGVLRPQPPQQMNRPLSSQQLAGGVKNIAALSPAQQQHLKEQAEKLAKEESLYEMEEASKIKRLQLAQSDSVSFFLTTLSHAFGLNEEENKLVLKNANNLSNLANKKQLSPSLTRGLTPSAILQTPTPFNIKTPLSQQRKTTPPSPKSKGSNSDGEWTGDVKPLALRAAFKEVPAISKTIINFTILTPPDDDTEKNKNLVKKNIFVNDKKRPIEDENDFIIVNPDEDEEEEKFDLKKIKIGYYEEEKPVGDSIWDMEF